MSGEYDEIQFAAHHSRFRATPSVEAHDRLYQLLVRTPGLVPYRQQFIQGRDEQHSLAVIIQDNGRRRELQEQVRLLAQSCGIAIDLVHRRSGAYLDRVLAEALPGQFSTLTESIKPCVGCTNAAKLDDSGLCSDCVDRTTYEVIEKEHQGERFHVINRRYQVRVYASNDRKAAEAVAHDWTAGKRAEALNGALRTPVRSAITAVTQGQPVPAAARKLVRRKLVRGDVAEYVDESGQSRTVTVLREHHSTAHGRGYNVRDEAGRNHWVPSSGLKPRA